ncbi:MULTISPECIES: type II toxin-antitoxin system HicA family toxin [unclassified Paraburkholderia]|uniref:type II toxin-antitoxin system HicA family toxin n=1 Tax=unclassified Paraburkholderia TaxID=2615204 RepID=UPI00160D51E0|nr:MULTISPECIES: type II toxin-antitoxin system HicA family toxin [unclassified Paraburkholderia]MBB5446048.1 putative RNA binding protein YcfA (HicA-like mRNA interferase family) [Paraburkholderia sp. WSM4177]MBB5486521.1 putative RNA binding protein YcfA (HicA-like mRNA interferase family) [Paraburkholderia sp. WSM4180]
MNSAEVVKLIQANGWQLVRTAGSHHHFRHPGKRGLVTVPHPKKDLPAGTLNSILKQAGLK